MTAISTPFELEIREWSQIQGEKNIFPDLIYFSENRLIRSRNVLHMRKKGQLCKNLTTTISALHSYEHHFYTLRARNSRLVSDSS